MVGKESWQTKHIERWNDTLRQRICRFSEKGFHFQNVMKCMNFYLKLFVYNYNMECVNKITY